MCFQKFLKNSIPDFIVNILITSGYDNALWFDEFGDEDISVIENFLWVNKAICLFKAIRAKRINFSKVRDYNYWYKGKTRRREREERERRKKGKHKKKETVNKRDKKYRKKKRGGGTQQIGKCNKFANQI